jgi:hypothetical protein
LIKTASAWPLGNIRSNHLAGIIQLLSIVPHVYAQLKQKLSIETHDMYREVFSSALNFVRQHEISFEKQFGYDGRLVLAARRAFETLGGISSNATTDGDLAFSSDVKHQWLSDILHIAKRHRGVLSTNLSKSLYRGLRTGFHRETSIIAELVDTSSFLTPEKKLMEHVRAIGKAVNPAKVYSVSATDFGEVVRSIRTRRHTALTTVNMADMINSASAILKIVKERKGLLRNNRTALEVAVLLDELAHLELGDSKDDASDFIGEFSRFLIDQMLRSASHTVKRYCAESFQLLSYGTKISLNTKGKQHLRLNGPRIVY